MYKTLLDLEKDFFKYDKIADRTWLDSTLHDNFKEVGSSGIIFYKKDTINSLMALITKDSDDKLFYRTSIWIKENNLKLVFHQASKLNSDINLENTDSIIYYFVYRKGIF